MELRDVLLTHVVGPLLFLVLAVRFRPISRIDAALTVLTVASPVVLLWLVGLWHLFSVWMPPLLLVAVAGLVALSWRRSRGVPTHASRGLRTWMARAIKVALILFVCGRTVGALNGQTANGDEVALRFPLSDGRFYIGQGGSTAAVNYHVVNRTQRYALDIVKLTTWGNRASRLRSRDIRDYASFGVNVYAPCSGEVRQVERALPDNAIDGARDRARPAGNQVLLHCDGTDVEVLLAHLQAGSVRARMGEHLEAGHLVGAIGNSGNSTEPHLHMHAKRGGGPETGLEGEGAPMTFDGRFLVRNDTVTGTPVK